MNRNLLLIAIAAIAVVVIVGGVLLAGNGQTGPLSGSLGLTSTTLTLTASNCSGSGNVNFTLSGELRDSDGKAVVGRTVALRTARVNNGTPAADGLAVEFATTGPDGGYTFAKNEPATPNHDADTYVQYGAGFSGDALYSGCSSPIVRKLC